MSAECERIARIQARDFRLGFTLGDDVTGDGIEDAGMSNDATNAQRETLKIPSGDVTMVADAYGDPADPPVVLLHGGGQTRHSWGSTAADLGAKDWYAVTVDLRGHGESGWSPDGYGLDRFAGDVTCVADFLGRPPVYVGASLGGNASLAAIGLRPDRALGLVLVDVSPFLQPAGTSRIRDFMVSHAETGFGTLE